MVINALLGCECHFGRRLAIFLMKKQSFGRPRQIASTNGLLIAFDKYLEIEMNKFEFITPKQLENQTLV